MAWFAVRQFDEAAEWACDQRLRAPETSSRLTDYARALLALWMWQSARKGVPPT